MNGDEREALDAFRDAVNMQPAVLEAWLETAESREVGAKDGDGDGESVGHASGRRIVRLLRTRQDDYVAEDFAHMRKVVGYIHRHLAQRPGGDVRETRWRWSLKNWGHDPV